MQSFYVIRYDFNTKKFEPYDIMPYLIDKYKEAKNKLKTKEEFEQFIKAESMYQWWSRCEYEIILCGWPDTDVSEKWDIHKQVLMNIEIIADILMKNINK